MIGISLLKVGLPTPAGDILVLFKINVAPEPQNPSMLRR
jgi:hypothetical protein